MPAPAFISDLLLDEVELRPAAERVWSVLPPDAPAQRYDGRASLYDAVVGSGLYNRLVWRSSPRVYRAFAQRAVLSGAGPLLDAGCGSLVFTATEYARANRPLVLVDSSIGMLTAGRDRLDRAGGGDSPDVVFLQSDIRHLPFRRAAFPTVISMGMLHLFDDAADIVSALTDVTRPDGQVFLTSLVAETRIGTAYLSLLHRAGEVAAPRTRDRLVDELRSIQSRFAAPVEIACDGSVAFIAGRTCHDG